MTQLSQGITRSAAFSLVAGSMIGTGVFLKTASMAQLLGSGTAVLAAWGVAGVLSLMGALAYAEVGSRFPRAGGEYVYLREAYGPFIGFLYGWTRFWIGSPASVAAYGVGAASFLGAVVPLGEIGGKGLIALVLVWVFTLLNCLTVILGARVQTFLTFLKIGLILAITVGIFFASGGHGDFGGTAFQTFSPTVPSGASSSVFGFGSAFGMAMISALWAYDGWNNLPMASGEVISPKRNIPFALIAGTFCVVGVYALINTAYFYALPLSAITTASSSRYPDALPVATLAAQTFLGFRGASVLSWLMVISALGAMNGSILTGARVPYAMACNKLFFPALAAVHPITRVPIASVIVQGIVASLLSLTGTFDQLTEYVVFTSWIFYALVTFSIFRLRKDPATPGASFFVPFYPWLPICFTIASGTLLINTLVSSPKDSAFGLVFLALGVPAYFFFARRAGASGRQSRCG